jgi:hypothetical protein
MGKLTSRSPIRILMLAALASDAVERNGGVAESISMGQFDVPAL